MTLAITLVILGVLTQAMVLATSRRSSLVRFSQSCPNCGGRIPPMERPPTLHNCPGCTRSASLSDPLHRL